MNNQIGRRNDIIVIEKDNGLYDVAKEYGSYGNLIVKDNISFEEAVQYLRPVPPEMGEKHV